MKKTLVTTVLLSALSVAAPSQAEDLEFLLYNDTSADIVGFNVSPSDSDQWEENLIAGGYLPPGNETDVFIEDGLTTCVYDIRGTFSDGETVEDYGLDLCDLGEYTFTE